jgi:hypothetical protein
MSEKRKNEIIENIEATLATKGNTNPEARRTLITILEKVKNDAHVVAKRKGRTPKPEEPKEK